MNLTKNEWVTLRDWIDFNALFYSTECDLASNFQMYVNLYDQMSYFFHNLSDKKGTCYRNYLAHFPVAAPKIFPKNIFFIFSWKNLPWKIFLYFLIKAPSFAGNRTFLYFSLKSFSYISGKVYLEPWYTQNQRRTQNTGKHLWWNVLQK